MPIAEGLFLEDRAMLEGLAHGESPKNPEVASDLLMRWMRPRLDDKPTGNFTGTSDSAGFLAWLSRDVGDEPYQLIKQRDPKAAAEIRRQILVICFATQNRCERMSGVGLAMMAAKSHANAVRMLPEKLLGATDAVF